MFCFLPGSREPLQQRKRLWTKHTTTRYQMLIATLRYMQFEAPVSVKHRALEIVFRLVQVLRDGTRFMAKPMT
jgi:hypothetical protein